MPTIEERLRPDVSIDGWITMKEYLRRSGESSFQVHSRLKQGKWQRRVHYSRPDGGGAFINVIEAAKWIREDCPMSEGAEEAEDSAVEFPTPSDDFGTVVGILQLDEGMQGQVVEVQKFDTPVTFTEVTPITHHAFKAWVPQLLNGDDGPDVYANLTGMDMPEQGHGQLVLGPLTGDHQKARQFVTQEDCKSWCDKDHGNDFYFPVEKEFSVPL